MEAKCAAAGPGAAARARPGLVQDEHDEQAAAPLADLSAERLAELADELTRVRDGQLVLGRAVPAEQAARWTEAQYRTAALETFRALAPLYRLR